MDSLSWFDFLLLSGTIANILATVLIGLPAIYASIYLLQTHRIESQLPQHPELRTMRSRLLDLRSHVTARWNPTHHRMLVVGFYAFIYSASVQLLGSAPVTRLLFET